MHRKDACQETSLFPPKLAYAVFLFRMHCFDFQLGWLIFSAHNMMKPALLDHRQFRLKGRGIGMCPL